MYMEFPIITRNFPLKRKSNFPKISRKYKRVSHCHYHSVYTVIRHSSNRYSHRMPSSTIQIFMKGLEGKTTVIRIEEDATIKRLRERIVKLTTIPSEDLRIISTSKELQDKDPNNKIQYLQDYDIENNSNIFIVMRLLGGSYNIVESGAKVYGPDVELTSEPDMITFDDDKGGQRAKMPCGHAIGPESLTAFCRSLLSAGKYEFRCPHMEPKYCGRLWEFYTIKRFAVLTEDEKNEFHVKLAENYLFKGVKIQQCPRCESYCERKDSKSVRVICPICTRQKEELYEFCWFCLKTWLTNSTADCGNHGCSGEDPRIKLLRNAPKKAVIGVPNCPSIRSCPKCGLLIEHMEACKQMTCPCGQKFCFICLKKADASGKYTCGGWNFKCQIAEIQAKIA